MSAPLSHPEQWVHLNPAGIGRMPGAVRAVLAEYTRREDRYGPYELAEEFADVLDLGIHERLGTLLNAPAADTAPAAVGGAAALDALLSRLPLGPADRIWTTPYESAAVLSTLTGLRDRTRCRLEVVPLRADGDLDLAWMAARLDDSVALVSVVQVPSGPGILNPVEDIGRLLSGHRCLYAVDAAYAVGQVPVDVARIGCDLLTGDGWRFLGGPQGAGFAYTSERLRLALAPDGGEPPPRPSNAAVVALDAALARHPDAPGDSLFPQLLDAVTAVPGLEPILPGRIQSGILSFHHPRLPAGLIRHRLAELGVAVWKTVADRTPLLARASATGTAVRASVHHDNTAADIDRFGEALRRLVAGHRARPTVHPLHPAPGPGDEPAVIGAGGVLAAGAPAGGRRLRLLPPVS